jgi:hypothetical protein
MSFDKTNEMTYNTNVRNRKKCLLEITSHLNKLRFSSDIK